MKTVLYSSLNHQVKIDKINCFPKLGIIQAVLQTLNSKFQNIKISTTMYSVCVCVCVFTGVRTGQFDRNMRWWNSNLGKGLLHY